MRGVKRDRTSKRDLRLALALHRIALTQLHEFIVDNLDPDPAPIEDYVLDPDAAAAVVGLGHFAVRTYPD